MKYKQNCEEYDFVLHINATRLTDMRFKSYTYRQITLKYTAHDICQASPENVEPILSKGGQQCFKQQGELLVGHVRLIAVFAAICQGLVSLLLCKPVMNPK